MEVYLDNCATTKIYQEVKLGMNEIFDSYYANPSAMHKFGVEAENKVNNVAKIIAKTLGVTEDEIVFTSGATESNNTALLSCAKVLKRSGKHIISSDIEHPSVKKVLEYLQEEEGYEVTYLSVKKTGNIDLEEFKNSLREDTILVTFMLVNNELGTILPVNELAKLTKEFNDKIVFHVDATQGYLKYNINTKYIDMISVSAHKLHGPKGVGFLYLKKGIKYKPLLLGGSQQANRRAGTINVNDIVGMGIAIEKYYNSKEENFNKIKKLKEYFIENLRKNIDNIKINSPIDSTAPQVCSVTFNGVYSEVLLHALEEKFIYVSAGSACSSHSKKVNSVLVNSGLTKDEADSTIRFSFSEFNDIKELDYTIKELKVIVNMLRKFVRR